MILLIYSQPLSHYNFYSIQSMKNCSSKSSVGSKTQGKKNKNSIEDCVKLQKAFNSHGFKRQSSRYQCQNINPQKAAKQQLISCDRQSPEKKQRIMQSNDQNCFISGWIDRYLDSTNMQKQLVSPSSHFLLSRTRRQATENSEAFHNFVRVTNQKAMNKTVRISNNGPSLNQFSSISSRDNISTQFIQSNVLRQASNRQVRAATSVRNRIFKNFQNNYEEENTIPKLKKLLKKLESPEKKKETHLQKREKKALTRGKSQQPESYENFIERLKNRRGHTTKVEQILRSKQNKLNKEIPTSPNNFAQGDRNKNDASNPVHDSIVHFLKMNKKCRNGNGNETPRFFSKRYQQQRQQRTLKSILK